MSTRHVVRSVLGAMLASGFCLTPCAAAAQAPTPPKPAIESAEPVTIRVRLTVERLDNQKVVDSMPVEILVRANLPSGGQATLNHGVDVPLAQSATKDGVTNYSYRPVGNNVSISGARADDRMISFTLVFDLSSVGSETATQAGKTFRKFTIQTPVSVPPGQTVLVAMSTDAVNSETTRLSIRADIVR